MTHTDHGHILVTADWEEQLAVEVIDTGHGIPEDIVPIMFDAFVTTRSQESQGLGLGLHICRQITELMQGQITYHRAETAGSRFRVTLPLLISREGIAEITSSEAYQPGLKILLIDDDEIALEATSALLRTLGHAVIAVESAEAAIPAAAADNFDVIVTDVHLKAAGMSGLDGVRAIRSLPSTSPDCLILVLTGSALVDERERYLRAGVDGVLVKPFDASVDLRQLVSAKRSRVSGRGGTLADPI